MIHSILIVKNTPEERKNKALQLAENLLGKNPSNHPDFLLLEDPNSIKISHIREFQKNLALKPYLAPVKVVLISEAEKLTLPAQHALLKTLEEPPESSVIILTAPNKEVLLPTIISRCQIIQLSSSKKTLDFSFLVFHTSLFEQILSSSLGQRLLIVDQYIQNREQAKNFCEAQLIVLREILRQKITSINHPYLKIQNPLILNLSGKQISKLLQQIYNSLRFLEANVNPQIIVGNLLLSYPI